jgi:protease-4
MFSRRHPYLFFVLGMAIVGLAGTVVLALIVGLVSGRKLESDGENVGVVEIAGAIIDSQRIVEEIKSFRQNDAVKAIVVRIDSPGGGVGPSQEIYREIVKTLAHKKVVASMGGVAASGGYYVAAAASGIVANPGTITGSIGVIMHYTNFEEILRKIGLTSMVIKSGAYKDIGSPVRPMAPAEKAFLEELTRKIHQQFISDIAQGRKVDIAGIGALADGRIFTGEEAKQLGLVDRLGNFEDAVQWAAELGGIEGEPKLVYPEQKNLTMLRYLIESALTLWSESRSARGLVPQARWSPPLE